MASSKQKLTPKDKEDLLNTLEARFSASGPHRGTSWKDVRQRLAGSPAALNALVAMEGSGGEPGFLLKDKKTGKLIFCDMATESPTGRRSVCYDGVARKARKKHPPKTSALELAATFGADLMSPEEYQALQRSGEYDTKTSSWLLTPPDIRKLGGALFGDFRYGTTFIYHNGADSYYAARGFRCVVRV